MTTKKLKLGMIGLDTSHCTAFAKLLNDSANEYHVPGGTVMYGYPGGSPDFDMSHTRVEGFTATLRDEYGIAMLGSPEEVAERSDAILLTSVDGRVHLEQFRKIVGYGKPIFIDKPFALTTAEASAMVQSAQEHGVPIMSASSARFGQELLDVLEAEAKDDIIGADCYGPMELKPTQPGLYWYGIHSAEMLYRILGRGCVQVTAVTNDQYELVVGVWKDGRVGTIRGNRRGNKTFGGLIHGIKESVFVNTSKHPKPKYASLLEAVMSMFQTGQPPIDPQETIEIIRFLEAANESRATGATVRL
ncbi:Gfo/Idh/MocA family protein [Paenibacillus koleovorans]|uniref:Gfo/Idh/MocA family protein n=1 Tax=Paenibacillus koleovorans TaxID=121608 RepID=UPI000FDA3965|nr:Gfo/Idh/MocA family oxidoreductase [Paenibacillus koleovorans]